MRLTDEDAACGDDENKGVASEGIVVGTVTSREELEAGVEVVLGQGLENPGGTHQRSDG